jgi:hypothetical protein
VLQPCRSLKSVGQYDQTSVQGDHFGLIAGTLDIILGGYGIMQLFAECFSYSRAFFVYGVGAHIRQIAHTLFHLFEVQAVADFGIDGQNLFPVLCQFFQSNAFGLFQNKNIESWEVGSG